MHWMALRQLKERGVRTHPTTPYRGASMHHPGSPAPRRGPGEGAPSAALRATASGSTKVDPTGGWLSSRP